MKKREIYEVLDSDGNLIGSDDKPSNNPNEIGADGTTDHNVGISGQHFAHDFLGRFGMNMYNESEAGDETLSTDDTLMKIAREAYNYFVNTGDNPTAFESIERSMQEHYYTFAKKVMHLFGAKSKADVEPTLSESELSKMIEDVVTSRIDKSIIKKNGDNDILDVKIKNKLKSLLNGLSDKDKGDLIKHLKK